MFPLTRSRYSPIGLQLGPRSVMLMQLAGSDGALEVHAMARAEISSPVDASPEELDRLTTQTLRQLIADHHFKGRSVVSCLGAQDLFVQNVRLPQLPAEEVAKVVNWEAEERLPYPAAEAEIRHLVAGQVRQDANIKQEVILMACHRGTIERHVAVLENAGLVPEAIDVEPCAVLRCLRRRPGSPADEARRAYLNLGESATTVLFAEGDQILFLKSIASGGSHLDVAVARHLALPLHEAARMRGSVTSAPELDPDDEIHRSVIEAIRDPLESIAAEIELCLRYYKVTFRGKPLENVVVTGCEASRWLIEFLSDRLRSVCLMGNPFEGLTRWPTAQSALECPWRWTTAMGLSLASLN